MIRIGTCGYSFRDWKGTAYPASLPGREMLPYYEKNLGLDTVEIDASFYAIPSAKTVQGWAERTGKDFRFAVKCHKGMTLNDRRPVTPPEVKSSPLFRQFRDAFTPMAESGKLLSILAQFGPVFFKNQVNRDYILEFRQYFKDVPLTIEFRHKSWLVGDECKETLQFLRENSLGYAAVDEPVAGSLPPLIPAVTAEPAYLRLHGRSRHWFGENSHLRYDYLYSDSELEEFIPIVRSFESSAAVTAVFFNNCHAGAAVRNALALRQMLGLNKGRETPDTPQQMELPMSIT
jgi:uncharacterized protein YecE (DUF72 family)